MQSELGRSMAREQETRATEAREMAWAPAGALPEPSKQAGYTYRWIRVSSYTQKDPRNVSAKTREGWEPVRIEEHPEFSMLVDSDSRFKDNVEVGGLLLCKLPNELVRQRQAFINKRTADQSEAVEANFLRQNDARMPLFRERRSSSSFGNGT